MGSSLVSPSSEIELRLVCTRDTNSPEGKRDELTFARLLGLFPGTGKKN